ncbi:MAG: hypothetical protein IPH71_14700 [Proteobacteria bacterium]|nr:hypothetical protein [Pseudomonadota bacterium]
MSGRRDAARIHAQAAAIGPLGQHEKPAAQRLGPQPHETAIGQPRRGFIDEALEISG